MNVLNLPSEHWDPGPNSVSTRMYTKLSPKCHVGCLQLTHMLFCHFEHDGLNLISFRNGDQCLLNFSNRQRLELRVVFADHADLQLSWFEVLSYDSLQCIDSRLHSCIISSWGAVSHLLLQMCG